MGWEKRAGTLYYYRKKRVEGGRVRSLYMGRAAKAIEASQMDGVSVPDEVLAAPVAQPEVTDIRHVKKEGEDSETSMGWTQIIAQHTQTRHYRSIDYGKRIPDWLKGSRGY